jgi:hypothetical protein
MTQKSYLFLIGLTSILLVSAGVNAESSIGKNNLDHYMPGELNEIALESLRSNDFNSANIFIERAYRLNPLSPDINKNLEIIRSLGDSKSSYSITKHLKPNQSIDSESSLVNADTPLSPLWPKK